METKNERFRRIAEKRTNEIIEKIRILGNCSNKSTYQYSNEEVNKIFSTLEFELKQTKTKFTFKDRKKFNL